MTASQQELEDSLFEDPSFEEKSLRFATDVGCQVVYITRERYLDVDETGNRPPSGLVTILIYIDTPVARITYRLHLPPTPSHSPNILSTLALIKSSPTLDSLAPLGSQLHFVLLSTSGGGVPQLIGDDSPSGASTVVSTPSAQATPYDGLHSLVHWGVAPWFDSYVSSKQGLLEGPVTTKKGGEAQMGKQHTSHIVAKLTVFQVSP
jgi:dynein heavy chain 1